MIIDLLNFLKQWWQLLILSFLAAAAQMYMSGTKFTFFHYLMHVVIAILSAYITENICGYIGLHESLQTGLIGIAAYSSPHLLAALDNVAKAATKDPKKFLQMLLRQKD